MQSNLALQEQKANLSAEWNKFFNSLPEGINETILLAFMKCWDLVNDADNQNLYVSVSGGSDSDLMVDMICRCDVFSKAKYYNCDPGLEYTSVKEHLNELEDKYGITIARYRAKMPVVSVIREYGVPFVSKMVSEYVHRLQINGFQWEDEDYDTLIKKYPNAASALRWWTNTKKSPKCNIRKNMYLKEFLIANHGVDFKVSNMCCTKSKEATLKEVFKSSGKGISITGLRKAEGGSRSTAYSSCTTWEGTGVGTFRPIWWFTEKDKQLYCELFDVHHASCYSAPDYPLKRTGCCCCPNACSKNRINEMLYAKEYDPMMYKAVKNIFGQSFELEDAYREFAKGMKNSIKKV